jgi:hypothetical protein
MWDLWKAKWHWDRFSPSTSVFPRQFHSTGAPLLGKGQKIIIIIIIIFIAGLHKKPQGCGASVASAAGPFTNKKKKGRKEVEEINQRGRNRRTQWRKWERES